MLLYHFVQFLKFRMAVDILLLWPLKMKPVSPDICAEYGDDFKDFISTKLLCSSDASFWLDLEMRHIINKLYKHPFQLVSKKKCTCASPEKHGLHFPVHVREDGAALQLISGP